jgi:hypothetical protein
VKPSTIKPVPRDDVYDAGYATGEVLGVVLVVVGLLVVVLSPILLFCWIRGAPARKARREAEERAREEARQRAYAQAQEALRADYEQLAAKYGADAARRIMNREIWKGAPAEAVLRARGQPADIEEKVFKTKVEHVYKYMPTGQNRYALRFFIEDRVVTGWGDETTPLKLFYSYAHEDEDLREALQTHLMILERQGLIEPWHDRAISAGTEWAGAIDEHLEKADVILLLVSANFLASDYIFDIELKRAMEKHHANQARVIPIFIKPCDWSGTPFGKLQGLPKDTMPVTEWPNQDAAWTDVAKGIRRAVEDIRGVVCPELEDRTWPR